MNQFVQNIGVLVLFLGALYFLVTKFFWKPAAKKTKVNDCGTGSCGCG
ncbi:FeoB-associated Cys-rich membrane protein [Aquimarina agarilytica]|nr:FeoB-associated Cys-rich membrane protein [Aquimarina agarilytica]